MLKQMAMFKHPLDKESGHPHHQIGNFVKGTEI